MSDKPLRVLVTGAAGQIGYALLYAVAKGDMFGPKQPISLVLLDIESMVTVLDGVVAELQDCALPLLREVIPTADVNLGFKDVDAAILVGAMPRRQGMERADLLKANIKIFKAQGKAINQHAKRTVKVVVVGNPANTNCFICKKYAPDIPAENFSCLTRLDQNRAQAQIAARLGVPNQAVRNTIIWGNHSSTQYPDVRHATVQSDGKSTPVLEAVKDDAWINNEFIKIVQTRGGEIIRLRKLSSAMSAAKAICDHMHDWTFGCKADEWVSMGVPSDGSYDIEKGLIYSFPVNVKSDGTYTIVKNLKIDEFSRAKMTATEAELSEEKGAALGECED